MLLTAVQVRSAHRSSDHGLTQKLPIAGTSVLIACQSTGNIFVAATGSDGIHQLAPVPFDQQARALADLEQFAEALSMIALSNDSQVHNLQAVLNTIIVQLFVCNFTAQQLVLAGPCLTGMSCCTLVDIANSTVLSLCCRPSMAEQCTGLHRALPIAFAVLKRPLLLTIWVPQTPDLLSTLPYGQHAIKHHKLQAVLDTCP